MDNKANYGLVGIFVISLCVFMVVVSLWLSTGLNHVSYNKYVVFMRESVDGLSLQAPVKYNGVTVGDVAEIRLDPKNPEQVELTLNIDRDAPILTSTQAALLPQGLTGIAYVSLKTADPDAPPLKAGLGQPYPVIQTRPSLFHELDSTVTLVSQNIQMMSDSVTRILNKENAEKLAHTLKNLDMLTTELVSGDQNLKAVINNAKVTLEHTALASQDLTPLFKSITVTNQKLQGLIDRWGRSTNEVDLTLKSGRTTLNAFKGEVMPEMARLLNEAKQLTKGLDLLTADLRQNPGVLVRGRHTPKPGPGETIPWGGPRE